MKQHEAKQFLPIIHAWADGKTIQMRCGTEDWRDCVDVGLTQPASDYRIKPEPNLRPWKPEEVPVGALLQGKGREHGWRAVISYASGNIVKGEGISLTLDSVFTWHEHSLDGGKTWLPCGVMEDEQ